MRRERTWIFLAGSTVLAGRTLFFVYPTTLRDRRTPLDFEKLLDIRGTARTARVVEQILARMTRSR